MKNLVLLFLIIGLISCNKRDTTSFTMKGTVTNYNTGAPVANVKIDIYQFTSAGTNAGTTLLETTYTESDGSYAVTFPREMVESYIITFQKEGFFSESITRQFSEFTTEEDNIYNFVYKPVGWVVFDIQNQAPTNAGDQMKIYKESGAEFCPDCCMDGFYYFDGPNIDTTWTCAAIADEWFVYRTWDLIGGAYEHDSVQIIQGDTIVIPVNY